MELTNRNQKALIGLLQGSSAPRGVILDLTWQHSSSNGLVAFDYINDTGSANRNLDMDHPPDLRGPSLQEKLELAVCLAVRLPVFLLWNVIRYFLNQQPPQKSLRRILGDKAFLLLTSALKPRQLRYVFGDTNQVYTAWAKSQDVPMVVDDLDHGAKLFWIGPRQTDKVILYLHGGAFLFAMQEFAATFWKHIQSELEEQGTEVGVAILYYTLVPDAMFPTQLRQALVAIQHLFSKGVQPQNLQIVGDSAGGNLALQVLMHSLHPIDDLPSLKLSAPFRGVYVMSPWVTLTAETGSKSMGGKDDLDMINAQSLHYWGGEVLRGVPSSQQIYLEPSTAPKTWFENLDRVVNRILITAGDDESLRDDIVQFAEKIRDVHKDAQFVLQPGGVHNDPYMDFLARETKLGELTPVILNFLKEGFQP